MANPTPSARPPRRRRSGRVAMLFSLAVLLGAAVWAAVSTYQSYKASTTEAEMTIATPRSFMLSGTISESAPTTNVGLPDAQIQVWAGGQQLASTNTDADGHYYVQGLNGDVELRISAPGYGSIKHELLAFRDENLNLSLTPVPKTIDQTLTGTIKRTDPQCYLIHACYVYTINAHHDGPVDATLTWPDDDVYLMLQLYVPETGQIITQGQDLWVTKQSISASLAAGTRYELRIVYENGSKPTNFTLVTKHPN